MEQVTKFNSGEFTFNELLDRKLEVKESIGHIVHQIGQYRVDESEGLPTDEDWLKRAYHSKNKLCFENRVIKYETKKRNRSYNDSVQSIFIAMIKDKLGHEAFMEVMHEAKEQAGNKGESL